MSKFEDSLWADMQREHGQALLQSMAKYRSRRTARWIGAAAAIAVLGTGALAASAYFGGAPPAYAVVDNPDGSVTLTIREVQAFESATAELRERGIRAFAVPMLEECSMDEYRKMQGFLASPRVGDPPSPVEWDPHDDMFKMKIHRDRIPADAKLVLSAFQFDHQGMSLYVGYVRGEMPTCVPMGERPRPIPTSLPTMSR